MVTNSTIYWNSRKDSDYDYSLVTGYIGAGFLFIRFLPVLAEQIQEPKKLNKYFLISELVASIFLGTSAILQKSIPFILANCTSLFYIIVIIVIQVKLHLTIAIKPENNSP
jgi:uncharacterized protein with PQ loop repeat